MATLYDSGAHRRAVNLSLNADLIAKARAEQLNLSAIAEEAICRALGLAAKRRFEAEIARSVTEYEEYLAAYGSFADAVLAMEAGGDS